MENALEKIKTQKVKVLFGYFVTFLTVQALLFFGVILLTCGCEEVLKQTPVKPPVAGAAAGGQLSEAARIILESLSDEDPSVRVIAIEVVAATGQIRMVPRVERLLRDKFVQVRFAAALAIGDLQYSLARKSVQQLLKDRDPNVKIAASYAMIRLGYPQYSKVLIKAITSKNQTVRANSALILGKLGDRSALNLLHWAIKQDDSDDKVLFQAAESIAMLGDEQIVPKLWAMLISVYADDRLMGIKAMGQLRTAKAKNAIITMLDDPILEIRLAAAEQLGELGDTIGEREVLDVFEKNLTAGMEKEDIELVNMRVALAIGQIGTSSLTKYLPQLLIDESKFVRLAAAKATFQCAKRG